MNDWENESYKNCIIWIELKKVNHHQFWASNIKLNLSFERSCAADEFLNARVAGEDEQDGPVAHGQRLVAVQGEDMAVEGAAMQDGAVVGNMP